MEKKEETAADSTDCPICGKNFPSNAIEVHVNRCIFLNTKDEDDKPKESKRSFGVFSQNNLSPTVESKKFKKTSTNAKSPSTSAAKKDFLYSKTENFLHAPKKEKEHSNETSTDSETRDPVHSDKDDSIPLAEKMRPTSIDEYIGQDHVIGKDAIIRKILDKNEIPSMILWGPPGVGKVFIFRGDNQFKIIVILITDNVSQHYSAQMQRDTKCSICKTISDNGRSE